MKRISFLIFLLLNTFLLTAQFKLNVNGGISNNLNAQNDSVGLAAKNGTSFAIKPSYSFGRVAIATNIGVTNHGGIDAATALQRVTLDTGFRAPNTPNSGISNVSVFTGPELCICFKNIKIIPSVKVGFIQTKIKEYTLDFPRPNGGGLAYTAASQTSTDFGTQTGLQLGYKINKHVSIGLQSELTNYTTTFNVRDSRLGTTPRPKEQKYNFLKLGAGVTYSF